MSKQEYWDGYVKDAVDRLQSEEQLLADITGGVAPELAGCSDAEYAIKLMSAWVRIGELVQHRRSSVGGRHIAL